MLFETFLIFSNFLKQNWFWLTGGFGMKGFFSLVLIGTTRLELIFYIVVADGFLLDLNNIYLCICSTRRIQPTWIHHLFEDWPKIDGGEMYFEISWKIKTFLGKITKVKVHDSRKSRGQIHAFWSCKKCYVRNTCWIFWKNKKQ